MKLHEEEDEERDGYMQRTKHRQMYLMSCLLMKMLHMMLMYAVFRCFNYFFYEVIIIVLFLVWHIFLELIMSMMISIIMYFS